MTNRRKNIGVICLMIATFLNPLGYDVAFAAVMKLTGDYWTTTYIFYVFAVLFFLLSFYLLKLNPIEAIKRSIKGLVGPLKRKKENNENS
jgi:hypothetical protein